MRVRHQHCIALHFNDTKVAFRIHLGHTRYNHGVCLHYTLYSLIANSYTYPSFCPSLLCSSSSLLSSLYQFWFCFAFFLPFRFGRGGSCYSIHGVSTADFLLLVCLLVLFLLYGSSYMAIEYPGCLCFLFWDSGRFGVEVQVSCLTAWLGWIGLCCVVFSGVCLGLACCLGRLQSLLVLIEFLKWDSGGWVDIY
ncbi:hypothetical protein N658DRAFT_227905 [Parathielavia hyrcaniae]|uniref:Transmembrane protein n=1 Tax=Parathielavia hyrcaniae TaxID=113614 RepID=A0AAN6PZD7_9PEZI|nr:hypothetical protein N658DRAFT_227905 [Parathielavia hyrcaniae]